MLEHASDNYIMEQETRSVHTHTHTHTGVLVTLQCLSSLPAGLEYQECFKSWELRVFRSVWLYTTCRYEGEGVKICMRVFVHLCVCMHACMHVWLICQCLFAVLTDHESMPC